jgi:hypothetical protein
MLQAKLRNHQSHKGDQYITVWTLPLLLKKNAATQIRFGRQA